MKTTINQMGNHLNRSYLFAFLAFIISLSGCKKETNIEIREPDLRFLACNGCVNGDISLPVDTTFKIKIEAYQGTSPLSNIEVSLAGNIEREIILSGPEQSAFIGEINGLQVPGTTGVYTLEVVVRDDAGQKHQVSFDITAVKKDEPEPEPVGPQLQFTVCEECVTDNDTLYIDEYLIMGITATLGDEPLISLDAFIGEDYTFEVPLSTAEQEEGFTNKQYIYQLTDIQPGEYVMSVLVTDANGLEARDEISIVVEKHKEPPAVSFQSCESCISLNGIIYKDVPFSISTTGIAGDGTLTSLYVLLEEGDTLSVYDLEGPDNEGFDNKIFDNIFFKGEIVPGKDYRLQIMLKDSNGKIATDVMKINIVEPEPPGINFQSCIGCVSENATLYQGLIFKIRLLGVNGSVALNTLTLEIGEANFDVSLNQGEMQSGFVAKEVEISLEGVDPGIHTLRAILHDANGLADTAEIADVEVKTPVVTTYTNKTLYYPRYVNLPSFFSASTGQLYVDGVSAAPNAEIIDFAYFTTISGNGMLASPHLNTINSYFEIESWSQRNITKIAVSEAIDFDNVSLQELADIDPGPNYFVNIASLQGKTIIFKTSDHKKGVIKVVEYTKITDEYTKMRFDIKVFK